MTALDVLNECRRLGLRLEATLRFAPAAKMPSRLLHYVQQHKRALIALLNSPEYVLVVAHADGYLEVFGDGRRVRVHLAHRLDVSPASETAAEAYLDTQLPAPYRDMHVPSCLLASGSMKQCRTVSAEFDRLDGLQLLRALEPLKFLKHNTATKS